MEEGEERKIIFEKGEAYGDYREELKRDITKDALPKEPELKEGMILVMGTPDGHQVPARIVEIKEDKVTLDLNHPLAGKKLVFKIKVLDIDSGNIRKIEVRKK